MLVQLLGMFAQFERDTIIDRVIAGMERKAAKGKWKGGRRPFGYTVNKGAHQLIPHEQEAGIVRLIFDLYTRDRLGGKVIARVLNDRGHRTTTSGRWSAYQVLRVLANRVYLGELSFRDILTTGCHESIVIPEVSSKPSRSWPPVARTTATALPMDRTTSSPARCAAPSATGP
ncbi:MAG: recombinase family protein [Pseudonocardiaceae bacterium]